MFSESNDRKVAVFAFISCFNYSSDNESGLSEKAIHT